jgi:hypothetical protein
MTGKKNQYTRRASYSKRRASYSKRRASYSKRRASYSNKNAISGLARTIIPMFLEMINTIKIYHWKTTSYSTHKATDDLFSNLNSKTDEFVEVLLGKSEINRDSVLVFPSVKIDMFSTGKECRKHIERYKSFLLDLPNDKNFASMANVDLLAIRDEILALLNQFLYLLTLN